MNLEKIESFIKKFPVYQYAFLSTEQVEFSDKMRLFCKRSCPHYGSSWSCPPATGKLDKCKEHCLRYTDLLLFSTVTEIPRAREKEKKIEAQIEHEKLTRLINNHMRDLGYLTYVLSSSFCKHCSKCSFPKDYCRHPEEMIPCIESHGIVVADLMEKCDMDYYMGERLQLMFSLIFFKDTGFIFSEK